MVRLWTQQEWATELGVTKRWMRERIAGLLASKTLRRHGQRFAGDDDVVRGYFLTGEGPQAARPKRAL